MAKTKRSTRWVKKINALSKQKYAGVHLLAEFWQGKIIEDADRIEKILLAAAKASDSTALKTSVHKFSPQGLTGFVLLAESHIAIHTWPEYNYIAVDIFTCGEKSMPEKAFEYLKKVFKPISFEMQEIKRGRIK
jgi:S-adenosylmethionine decarboxylase proenzyme